MERFIIEHCSPTLASLKTANLFNYMFDTETELYSYLRELNKKLSGKGVKATLLRKTERSALVYLFREKKLQQDLEQPGVRQFMRQYGYENPSAKQAVWLSIISTSAKRFSAAFQYPTSCDQML